MTALANGDLYRVLQVDRSAHPNVIRAAYRALAAMFHPDLPNGGDEPAMVRINRAYEVLRDPERRRAYNAELDTARRQEPSPSPVPVRRSPPPPRADSGASVIPFGRYQGWSIDQLLRRDPDYLRWFSRHRSGLQYRAEIERLFERQARQKTRGSAAAVR